MLQSSAANTHADRLRIPASIYRIRPKRALLACSDS
jgi:hypothetical protein